MDMYEGPTIQLTVGRKTMGRININAVVKQGCPLSPLLFKLIIDQLIERLKKLNIGIQVGEELFCVMVFTDDLVLLREHRIHMQILLEEFKDFLDQKGLMANPGKCASLRVIPVV